MSRNLNNSFAPSIIWVQCMDFMGAYAKQMRNEYMERMRKGESFEWTDLDNMLMDVHNKLDIVALKKNIEQPNQ